VLLDDNALLIQILVLQFFAQTEQVFRDYGIVQSSSCNRFSIRQSPDSFPESKAEVLATAFVLCEIVQVLARLILFHVVGREVIQTQRMIFTVAFSYTETVISETLADTKRELPNTLRTKFQHIKKYNYKKLILTLLKIYKILFTYCTVTVQYYILYKQVNVNKKFILSQNLPITKLYTNFYFVNQIIFVGFVTFL